MPGVLLAFAAAVLARPPADYTASFRAPAPSGARLAPRTWPAPPEQGAWDTGKYRNLFVEAGSAASAAATDARIEAIFAQLFHGNPANESVYFPGSGGGGGVAEGAYILDVGDNDVRSEGIGYGLMAAVQLDKRAEFDAIYTWAKNNMQHNDPADARYGYFSWHCSAAGAPKDPNPASDGESWIVTALYFAEARWGSDGDADHGDVPRRP